MECSVGTKNILFDCIYGFFIYAVFFFDGATGKLCDTHSVRVQTMPSFYSC